MLATITKFFSSSTGGLCAKIGAVATALVTIYTLHSNIVDNARKNAYLKAQTEFNKKVNEENAKVLAVAKLEFEKQSKAYNDELKIALAKATKKKEDYYNQLLKKERLKNIELSKSEATKNELIKRAESVRDTLSSDAVQLLHETRNQIKPPVDYDLTDH